VGGGKKCKVGHADIWAKSSSANFSKGKQKEQSCYCLGAIASPSNGKLQELKVLEVLILELSQFTQISFD
jgi:hypothetical protein